MLVTEEEAKTKWCPDSWGGRRIVDGDKGGCIGSACMAWRWGTERSVFADAATLEELEMSVRTTQCLRNAAITTMGEIRRMSDAALLSLPNFGRSCLAEVKQTMAERRLAPVPVGYCGKAGHP